MPLQSQTREFPIVGGVDEKTGARVVMRMQTMNNCRYTKSGILSKRYGTTCVGLYNKDLGGVTPPAAELLTTRGNELVRVGRDELSTQQTIGASSDWVRRSFKPEAVVYRDNVAAGEPNVYDPDVGYANGFAVYAYATALIGGTTLELRAEVINLATGSHVYSSYTIDTAVGVSISQPRVLVIGNEVIILWQRNAILRCTKIDTTTLTWTATANLAGGGGLVAFVLAFDACAISGTSNFAVAFETAAGPPYIKVGTWTSAFAAVVAPTGIGVDQFCTAFALRGTAGEYLWLAYAVYLIGPTTYQVKVIGLDPATLATVVALHNITAAVVSTPGVINVGVERTSATTAVVTWTVTTESFRYVEIDNLGTTNATTTLARLYAVSRPFRDATTGHTYILMLNNHATNGTLFLCALGLLNADPANTTNALRMVATIAPRQVPPVTQASGTNYWRGFSSISAAASVGSGRYLLAAYVTGSSFSTYTGAMLDVRLANTKPTGLQQGNLLSLSGGVPSGYDGQTVAEYGFAYEPDTSICTVTGAAGGALTTNSTYRYLLVYEWYFADGSVDRSSPSNPAVPLTLNTVANTRAQIVVPNLQMSNKAKDIGQIRRVAIVVYRTTAGGSTYYRQTAIDVPTSNMSDPGSATKTAFNDDLADSVLVTRPFIYTTGGVISNVIPPSSGFAAAIDNRVWLANTEDDSIWFSRFLVDGEAPGFNDTFVIPPFDRALGRVQAVAPLDEKKILFKTDAIYVVLGQGPSDTGAGDTYSTPARIPSEVGCIEPRSIVATPEGLMFQSRSGIYLLTRSLTVVPVGKQIEDTLGAHAVVAATLVPELNCVRFAIDTTDATVLEYDLFHGNASSPVWTVHRYYDQTLGAANTIAAATWWNGYWTYINSNGRTYSETFTAWTDTCGAQVVYVPMAWTTAPLSLTTRQDYQRVWHVSILGDRYTDHDLTITVRSDDDVDSTATRTFTTTDIGTWLRYQPQIHVVRQKCEAVTVGFADATPTSTVVGNGRGATLSSVAIEFGVKPGLRRAPPIQSA